VVRYHGVLSSHAKVRAEVVPRALRPKPKQLPLFEGDASILPPEPPPVEPGLGRVRGVREPPRAVTRPGGLGDRWARRTCEDRDGGATVRCPGGSSALSLDKVISAMRAAGADMSTT
jgi:hypothetical protein